MLIGFFLVIIIPLGQPLPWFHVKAWLPFRNSEMDYCKLGLPSCVTVDEYLPLPVVWSPLGPVPFDLVLPECLVQLNLSDDD